MHNLNLIRETLENPEMNVSPQNIWPEFFLCNEILTMRKIFANQISKKQLVYGIDKEPLKLNKTNNNLLKTDKRFENILS